MARRAEEGLNAAERATRDDDARRVDERLAFEKREAGELIIDL